MFKKEFRDTLLQLLESSLLLLAIPLIIGLTLLFGLDVLIAELINAVSIITLFAFAGYSGLGMFQTERKDKGFEYLLALPMSKLKIFLFKVIPRFAVLMVLTGLAILFFNITFTGVVLPLIFLHLGGVFLSLAFYSLFAGFIAVVLLGFFYSLSHMFIIHAFNYVAQIYFSPFSIISPPVLAALLLALPLGISFFLAFRKFDLKPYKYTIKPYFFIAAPLLLLQALIILVYFEKVAYFY